MKLEGKTFKMNVVLQMHVVDHTHDGVSFVKELDEALVQLCREMNVPFPLWLSRYLHLLRPVPLSVVLPNKLQNQAKRFQDSEIRVIGEQSLHYALLRKYKLWCYP